MTSRLPFSLMDKKRKAAPDSRRAGRASFPHHETSTLTPNFRNATGHASRRRRPREIDHRLVARGVIAVDGRARKWNDWAAYKRYMAPRRIPAAASPPTWRTTPFTVSSAARSGNALDLWAQANRQSIYDAALDLCHRLQIPVPVLPSPQHRPTSRNREEETVESASATCTIT